MTDERIAKLERDLEFSAGPVVVVQTELVRWLLGEYRRDHPDAVRWRKMRRQVTANEIDKLMRRMPAVIDRSAIDAAVDAAIAREQADGKA